VPLHTAGLYREHLTGLQALGRASHLAGVRCGLGEQDLRDVIETGFNFQS